VTFTPVSCIVKREVWASSESAGAVADRLDRDDRWWSAWDDWVPLDGRLRSSALSTKVDPVRSRVHTGRSTDVPVAPEGALEVVEQLRRFPMSWEDFLELQVEGKAEWVDGEVVVSPPSNVGHGVVAARLTVVLANALPDLEVGSEVGVWLPRNRLRGPDLMVLRSLPATTYLEDAPLLVVEVLSPSTRAEDLLRKGPEYAAAGVGQYWVVDPDARSLEVFENLDGAWEPLLRLDDDHPTGEVAVGEHGVVPLDLTAILPG
jgi:Uma2 family endonuclease